MRTRFLVTVHGALANVVGTLRVPTAASSIQIAHLPCRHTECADYIGARSLGRLLLPFAICAFWPLAAPAQQPSTPLAKPSVIFKIHGQSERLEMTVHTSRILTMDQKIPQAQVNNPDILELTPLSPTQVQVSAKTAGVTQINLWGEDQKLYTVDVMVYGDAKELELMLRSAFPTAALKVTPVASAVMISGFVDQQERIERIIRIAEEYYPKVINNMTVGGCEQVLLRVKVMEVSRTKLRQFGFDFSNVNGPSVITSAPMGLLANAINSTPVAPSTPLNPTAPWAPSVVKGGGGTFAFGIANGNSAFFGVLDALRDDGLAKILAEPTLTTISGRPASFRSGGSFYIIPNGQNGGAPITVKYGTQVDFVPIVLGNGRIHLDIRSIISDIDPSLPSAYQPALKDRSAETGTELMAGQTLAIAGLVEYRSEAENAGLPWISEVPYLGAAFRTVKEQVNEIELVILVTPDLVEGMDACEVPPCGPGMQTTSPSDWELFMKGHLEVPKCCPTHGGVGGQCSNGDGHEGPPPDGMILDPGEKVPAPQPADQSMPFGTHSRYTPSKPNASAGAAASQTGPPGFIGPVGYDVVK